MEIIVNPLKSQIITDNQELINALSTLYTFKVKGAEFTPQYRNHVWDGTVSFITKKGVFSTGLLDNILTDLKKIKCEPEIYYKYPAQKFICEPVDLDNYTYYLFQRELIKKALYNRRGIIVSGTGSGKTIILAGLVKYLEHNSITILFPSKQLVVQTYEFLKSCGIKNLGINFGNNFENGKIMLSTVQSIHKIVDSHVAHSQVLIVDEVHEFANGKDRLAAINSFPKATIRFGLTATVPKDPIPKFNLIGAFGPVLQNMQTSSLISEGFLTKAEINLVDLDPPSGIVEGTYPEIYDEYIIHNTVRNQRIVDIVNQVRESTNTARILILVRNINHGNILADMIKGDISFIEGVNTIEERYNAINKMIKSKESSVLIGTKILQTGVNIEEITHFINARGLESEIATLQALGRSLRKHSSKNVVYVYDFIDKVDYLDKHSRARRKAYKAEGHPITIIK